jgi:translation initiation factor IF-2
VTKLRVTDIAGEFGISTEEVLALLRQMDVSVRSHMTPLTDDQVARVRARWEREKRSRAEKPAGPARRRRGAAAAATDAPAPKARTSRGKPVEAAPQPVAEAPAIRRRRRATDGDGGAASGGEGETSGTVTTISIGAPQPEPVVPHEEVPGEIQVTTAAPTQAPPAGVAGPAAPPKPSPKTGEPTAPGVAPSAQLTAPPAAAGAGAPLAPAGPRPRPIAPGSPRPRPVASGAPSPRPVASATPGGPPPARREDRPAPAAGAPRRDDRRARKGRRGSVDQEAVSANISRTMTAMRGPARRTRRSDEPREDAEALRAAAERERKTVHVTEFITVAELADVLKVPATQIVGFALKNLGLMVTVNQRLDFDQIELIAGEFGYNAVREEEYAADVGAQVADRPEDLEPRPPVVTIMGHVDHGKTSLLDYVRKANVVAGEAGGITQHIGAYHVSLADGRHITFLDTPGHEAFTAMRARGAQVTDIVVLVVAADDQVMPQTIEAISHAKNAGVPIIVAINKMDLPGANAPKVKQDLLGQGVVLEEFGGTTLASEISAKNGTGIQELLDQVLLQAEILDLRANPNRQAVGSVVEAQLDPGKGPVATVLVQNGTLRVGHDFICGMYSGRVRALLDERGRPVKEAGPAIPVQVLGLSGGVPMAGDQFLVVEDATEARDIAQRRERLEREARSRRTSRIVSLEDFMTAAAAGDKRTLPIIIKADQGGPAEALADALAQLSTEEVSVEVIHRGVGAISESDILLARTGGAVIVGFHVRPDNNARAAAEREGVDIKLYKVIYEAVEDMRLALEGMLRPEEREVVYGEAEVLQVFKISRLGTIAGCAVRSGIMNRQGRVRVVRDGVEVYDGMINSLKRFKDDVREVREGFECGIGIENFNDIKVGDRIEAYRKEEVARTLASAATA